MAKAKFFRVAVEGPTVDGRNIERQHLLDCAANYDPATYTARINCSHIVGYGPDAPFNSYGTVLSLKTEEITLNVAGQNVQRLALYAELDANGQLVAINRANQKLFTSCEIHPDFAGTGKAYLVGLAVTDTPASLGTEPLKFAAMSRSNMFTGALEGAALEFEAAPADAATIGQSIGAALVAFFKRDAPELTAANGLAPAAPAVPAAPVAPTPPSQGGSGGAANDNAADVAELAAVVGQAVADASKPANDAVAALTARFDALETSLAGTPKPGGIQRLAATGASGSAIVTDC